MTIEDLQMTVVSLKKLLEKLSPENSEQLSKCSLAELDLVQQSAKRMEQCK
jgi:hypothetical protein